MHTVTLYGTLGCHLCEDAMSVMQSSARFSQIAINSVDIADNDALLALYSLKIPVLKQTNTQKLLCWPFDLAAFDAWLMLGA
jgi:Glutaredoxin-like domain (DUF836)